jgi:hypothetical protein
MDTLRSGSKWTARELQWLNVEYDPQKMYPINIPVTDLTPGLAKRTVPSAIYMLIQESNKSAMGSELSIWKP